MDSTAQAEAKYIDPEEARERLATIRSQIEVTSERDDEGWCYADLVEVVTEPPDDIDYDRLTEEGCAYIEAEMESQHEAEIRYRHLSGEDRAEVDRMLRHAEWDGYGYLMDRAVTQVLARKKVQS